MTDAELAEIEKRAEAMEHTPGCPAVADDESDFAALNDAGQCACSAQSAKQDVPALLAEVRKLRREQAELAGTWVPPEIAKKAARDSARAALDAAARSFEAVGRTEVARMLRELLREMDAPLA